MVPLGGVSIADGTSTIGGVMLAVLTIGTLTYGYVHIHRDRSGRLPLSGLVRSVLIVQANTSDAYVLDAKMLIIAEGAQAKELSAIVIR